MLPQHNVRLVQWLHKINKNVKLLHKMVNRRNRNFDLIPALPITLTEVSRVRDGPDGTAKYYIR